MAAGIRFEGVTKRFEGKEAVRDLNLEVEAGARLALLGPSGSGKTTALRMLAGIEVPDAGRIHLNGDTVNDPRVLVPPGSRAIGMVFQSLALWPHMTVERNLEFVRKGSKAPNRTAELLEMVNLAGHAKAYPHELSGGERQRVALARALVGEPKILLLDEPMANLDQGLKRDLLDAVRKIQEEVGVTMIYVTHDQREALSIGQTLAVMEGGRLLQTGSPLDLYYKPAGAFVARFLGRNNVLTGTAEGGTFRCPAGAFPLDDDVPGGEVTVAIRAEDIVLRPDPEGPLTAISCVFQGARHVVVCSAGDFEIIAESPEGIAPGARLSAESRRSAYVLPS